MTRSGTKPLDKEVPGKVSSLINHLYLYTIIILGDGDQKTASKKDGQLILTESDIPAKEIKLAKILMDKPAPHCSAQSWAIYD